MVIRRPKKRYYYLLAAVAFLGIVFWISATYIDPEIQDSARLPIESDAKSGDDREKKKSSQVRLAISEDPSATILEPELVATITIPHGQTHTIKLRPREISEIPYPDNLAKEYAQLESRALDGDAAAARLLYKALDECSQARWSSKAELNSDIAEAQKAYLNENYADQSITEPAPSRSGMELLAESMLRTFEFCEGLNRNGIDDRLGWLELAASLGDTLANYELGTQVHGKSAEGVRRLKLSWEQGNIFAAGWLANYLEDSDPVASHAYRYLYAQLLEADVAANKMPSHHYATWAAQARDAVEQEGIALGQYDRKRSLQIASEILGSNIECCISQLARPVLKSIN